MSVESLIANSLRIASEDLEAARDLARTGNRNSIYLCEQAAEKVIRAVMTSEGLRAGTTHILQAMVAQIPDANPMKPTLAGISYLAAYATSYRYPTSSGRISPAPSAADVAEAIRKVEITLGDVAARFEVDLKNSGTGAKRPGPIR